MSGSSRWTRFGPALMVLSVLVGAVACGGDDDGAGTGGGGGTNGDVVRIALPTDIPNLDPYSSVTVWIRAVWWENVGEPLLTMDGSSADPLPRLAESWEQRDETTWAFKLREGVEFHNGEPFNAEAAAYSLNRFVDPAVENANRSYLDDMKSAVAEDDTTLVVETDKPFPALPAVLTFIPMVPPEHAESAPDALAREPVGTGPFVFVESNPDEVTLRRNDDYWGDQAAVDEVLLVARPDASARIAALEAGEVDIAWSVPVDQADRAPQVVDSPILEKFTAILNPLSGATIDPLVREAIVLATDNEEIRTSLVGEEQSQPGRCQIGDEGVVGFNEGLENQEFDPDRARELVEEAGAEGETIQIIAPSGRYVKGEEAAEVFAEQLSAVGLEPDLQIQPYQTFVDNFTVEPQTNRVEVVLVGISYDAWTVAPPYALFFAEGAGLPAYPAEGQAEISELLITANSAADEAEREAAFDQMGELICAENVMDFLYVPHAIWGVSDGLSWDVRRDDRIAFETLRWDD